MIRASLLAAGVLVSMLASGCCGPMGCGPGCGDNSCYDCDGTASRPIPNGPLDGIRQFKRSLVCGGGGCGETYVGEWISTPPDAQDPCCGEQWVGGATACRPFCWQRGALLRGAMGNLYGSRFCSGAESSAPCGCGYGDCDGGCGYEDEYYDGEYYEGDYFDGEYVDDGLLSQGRISSRNSRTARQDPRVKAIRR